VRAWTFADATERAPIPRAVRELFRALAWQNCDVPRRDRRQPLGCNANVLHRQFRRDVGNPVVERDILITWCLEHLEKNEIRVAGILDLVAECFRRIAHVARVEIGGA